MPVNFLSDTQWEVFSCSPWSPNSGERTELRAQLSDLRGSFYRGRGQAAPYDTKIQLQICEKADSEKAYNESSVATVITSWARPAAWPLAY
jgi:hypothetical protein